MKRRELSRRAALVNVPLAPILLAAGVCFGLRIIALVLDPEHRWWLPITMVQQSDFGPIGDAIIAAPLIAAWSLLRRMVRANEWEEILVLALGAICHVQLLLPWGRYGTGHGVLAFGTFLTYAWLLFQAAYRNRSVSLLLFGAAMVFTTAAAAAALWADHLQLFGVLEHLLLAGLLLGFWWYDRAMVTAALRREASPETCRLNNFGPPFL